MRTEAILDRFYYKWRIKGMQLKRAKALDKLLPRLDYFNDLKIERVILPESTSLWQMKDLPRSLNAKIDLSFI